jgi:hypothetical protein
MNLRPLFPNHPNQYLVRLIFESYAPRLAERVARYTLRHVLETAQQLASLGSAYRGRSCAPSLGQRRVRLRRADLHPL